MESIETTTETSGRKPSGTDIAAAYQQHLLEYGSRPASVYKFCKDQSITEDYFYTVYGSFEAIEKVIWTGFIDKTLARLKADDTFASFSGREQVLSFYFTLMEELRANRSFILLQLSGISKIESTPVFLKEFRTSFETFITSVLWKSRERGEVATRPFIDERYPKLFWLHMGFILMFWRNDDSPGFEKTDAAIEKSVNLAFDLIGKGAVDSAIDFGKFLYQNRR